MRYLSVCSGIEAASAAWEPLGWEPVAFSEIEPFPAAVLKHHYPNVPNLGDMTKIKGEDYRGAVDILVGGTPCQAFSVAGLRAGLVDPRGNLTLTFAKLADDIQPPYILWENVPGVLSSKDNALGCFLGLLAGEDDALVPPGGKWTDAGFVLGPKRAIAWRVLDAQYFGLAQRRRRVFVVACPRGGADPREILFEREGLRRDTPPSREAGQGTTHDVAPCIGASGRGFERGGDTRGQDPVVAVPEVAPPLMCGGGPAASHNARSGCSKDAVLIPTCITGPITPALKAEGFDASEDGTGRGQPIICQEVADTITSVFHKHHGASGGKDCQARNHIACFGGNNTSGPIDVATARSASGSASGRLDFESETFAVSIALRGRDGGGACEMGDDKAHALRCGGGGDKPHVLAFQSSQSGVRRGDTHATLDSNNGSRRHHGILAFHQNQRAEVTMNDTAGALNKGGGKPGQGYPAVFLHTNKGRPDGRQSKHTDMVSVKPLVETLTTDGHARSAVAYSTKLHNTASNQSGKIYEEYTVGLDVNSPPPALLTAMQVRRLTPRECERLQGFPDDYTRIPVRRFAVPKITSNRPEDMWELIDGQWWLMMADGPRYKMLGNSMAVPCMAWIGNRIKRVVDMMLERGVWVPASLPLMQMEARG